VSSCRCCINSSTLYRVPVAVPRPGISMPFTGMKMKCVT
jgi:hypothetical protein